MEKKRGRISAKEIIEDKIKSSLWDFIRANCPKGSCAEGIIWKLKEVTEVEINAPTLLRYIEAGIQNKEVTENDYFFFLVKPKKTRQPKQIQSKSSKKEKRIEDGYLFKFTCRECGASYKLNFLKEDCFGEDVDLYLKAKRCPKCQQWATLKAEGVIDEVPVIKAVIIGKKSRFAYETFVDENLNEINNPLKPETKEELNLIDQEVLQKLIKERQAKEYYLANRNKHDYVPNKRGRPKKKSEELSFSDSDSNEEEEEEAEQVTNEDE